ncbi:MAG: UDP-3-O-(3-hydroxymyristoyl)glucosamine N-acyltransferase [Candidatus Omnitrophica bacterium]|nr:UDP-3-O-(3-hydroxymyristoyl)glucosamine N-acyltransferase [Candidatus Omnitrophota bacterium]
MQIAVDEIAKLINGKVVGDADLIISGINSIDQAQPGQLTFIGNSKYLPQIQTTKASALIVSRDIEASDKTLIYVENPSLAFSKVASWFFKLSIPPIRGIHPTAVIGDLVKLGKAVAIGPHAVIENGVSIGDHTVIHAGAYVGHNVEIGHDCVIHPNVTICHHSILKNGIIIHSGSVIGSDGFGFEQVDGAHEKIPQIGIVYIDNHVEIGSNVTVDRARFDKTFIGEGTKIDNLVQIAHNVQIGKHCIIVSQVGISGSCVIGDYAILAGQAGVAGHLTIGEKSIVAAQAGVTKSIPPQSMVSGYPAKPHQHAKKVNACLQRLPDYINQLKHIQKQIEKLQK